MTATSRLAGALLGALATTASFSSATAATPAAAPQDLGAAAATQTTRFNVYLPLTHQSDLEQLIKEQTDSNSPQYHQWLTPSQFKERFGPSHAVVAQATAALRAAGLTVVEEQTQNLVVEGSVAAVGRAFSTNLHLTRMPQGRTKLTAAQRNLKLPAALAALGAVVPEFGLRPSARVHHKVVFRGSAEELAQAAANPLTRLSVIGGYYPNDLNEAYQLPSFRTEVAPLGSRHKAQIAGVGVHIGIVMSSKISPQDLAASFDSSVQLSSGPLIQAYSKNSNLPVPKVKIREVLGGSGPFDPVNNESAAFEASLDTQMSLGTAPGAQEILYDMPDLSDDSAIAAYTAVVEDNIADVVSSSFGGCELFYTAPYNDGVDMTGILRTYHALFLQGNSQGITFIASSGDNGALGCNTVAYITKQAQGTSFILGVQVPAADPSVTAVGGTNLVTSPTPTADDATYQAENADFDPRLSEDVFFPNDPVSNNIWGSGGGTSTIFAKPFYQLLANTGSATKRTIPDVSLMMGGCPGDADLDAQNCLALPRSFALVWVGGGLAGLIGTSASAPEFAGVTALAIELNGGRLGNVNPTIYTLATVQTLAGGVNAPAPLQFFHRSISGNNGFYTVKPGQAYSQVLGNSTLDVKNFLGLQLAAPAGTPNTPSNP
jgi:subtilase family serine protease